jgi:heat shock protein HslJ
MNIEHVGRRAAFLGGLSVAALVIGVGACDVMDGASLTGPKAAWTSSAPIPAGTWRLVSLQEAGEPVSDIGAATFTAEFGADGRLSLAADCNRCSAVYEAGDRSLRIGVLACTRAYCAASAPLDTTYTNLVDSARTWSVGEDGRLELTSAAGTLRFTR